MTPPLVSVVMPVWRPRPEWLAEAVTSVLGERELPLELVVVDDGCEPPLETLLAVQDDRLRIVRVAHGGVAAARNAGLEQARGTFVRFFDADDVAAPGGTAHLVGLAAGREDVITYGATVMCDEHVRPRTLLVSDVEGDAEVACLLGRFSVRVVSMLFPRRVGEAAGPWDPDFPISVDWDWVLRALGHAEVRGSRNVVTYYRRHSSSLTRTAGVEAGERAGRRVIERFFLRHPELADGALRTQAEVALAVDRGVAYADAGAVGRGAGLVARAGVRSPRAAAAPAAAVARAAAARVLGRRRG